MSKKKSPEEKLLMKISFAEHSASCVREAIAEHNFVRAKEICELLSVKIDELLSVTDKK